MDAITAAAVAVNNPLLHSIDLLVDNVWVYAAVVLVLLFIGERRSSKRIKVLFSLTLVVLAVTAIKPLFAVDRPCFGQSACPSDYSFPSLHVAVAFALAIAFLDKRAFPFYVAFALFVAFTRMNLDVHTFRDIAGGLVIALLAYYATDLVWDRLDRGDAHG